MAFFAIGPSALAAEPTAPTGTPAAAIEEPDPALTGPRRAAAPKVAAPILSVDQPGHVHKWAHAKFDLSDGILTGVALAGAVGSLAIPTSESRWTNAPAFDRSARNALRLKSRSARFLARDLSDVFLALSVNQLLADPILAAGWGHQRPEVALEMALLNIETVAINQAINGIVAGIASRERPYSDGLCVGENAEQLRDCRTSKPYRSFYSGHTSTSFAVAGLTCMHHAQLPLYGGGAGDVAACVASLGVAGATGALRIMSDQHHTSDVLVGAVMGTAVGLGVPWLLRYRFHRIKSDDVTLSITPTTSGVNISGVF